MLLQNKKVAIIGAGPVGLTMARLLQQNGVEVTVFERDKDAFTRITGGTLDLHKGSGQDALDAAGLLQQYYDLSTPMGRTIADEQGNILLVKKPTVEEQYNNPEINRNDLRKMLLGSLASGTVVWDKKFTTLEPSSGKWLLRFQDEFTATADLVIGANGGMSKARSYVTDAVIKYTGTLILQGDILQPALTCPAVYKLCNDTILMVANGGSLLVANPKNGGLLSYSVIFKTPEELDSQNMFNDQNSDGIKAFLLKRLSHWHESYQQLIRTTTSFTVWSTRKIPVDKPWKTNRPLPITLIGDAAHIMPPFAGQGVNIGMLDALNLANNLTNGKFASVEAAIKDYEQKMFIYAAQAQLDTSTNEVHMRDPAFSFGEFQQ